MAMAMQHTGDPKDEIWKAIGDLSDLKLFGNEVLVAIYIRPQKTSSGIFLTDNYRDEDKWQGKIGLVLKKGGTSLVAETDKVEVNDWVLFRPSDGWGLTVNGVMCRLLDDRVIRGAPAKPDTIY
jgi:co-chaperonin GroES (HSP10)